MRDPVKDFVYMGVRIYFALAGATAVTFALWAAVQAMRG